MKKEVINYLDNHVFPQNILNNPDLLSKYVVGMPGLVYQNIPGHGSIEKALFLIEYFERREDKIEQEIVEKRPLRILIADNTKSHEYVDYLNTRFDVTVVNHNILGDNTKRLSQEVDLVLFTGGEDVNPALYGDKRGSWTGVNSRRDDYEMMIYEKLPFDMPKLGICRGGQFLTVMNGGKMIQDVNNHSGNHKITHVGSGQVYEITSTHHQMMFPFNLPDHRFELVAHSQYFQSTKYLNGNDEEFDLPKDFLEPEIIYYPESNSLCIQGHPEYNHCPEKTKQWCFKLMDMYLFKTISIPPKKEESYNRSKPLPIKPFIESKNPFSQNTYKTPEVLIKKKG